MYASLRSKPADGSTYRLVLLLAFIALVQIVFIRSGQDWGDDFAHYIMQAKHLAALDGYAAREYIPNPEVLNLGPQTVPPGLSVILTPIYALFGLNLTAMKIILIFIFTAGLYFLDGLFKDRLPQTWRYALILVVAFDPYIFGMRDHIETERPFLALMLASLWLMQRAYSLPPTGWRAMRRAVAIGLCIFAAFATRNVGLALFFVLPALDLIRFRRVTLFSIVAVGAAAVPSVIVGLLLRTTSGYAHLFTLTPAWIAHSTLYFAKNFAGFWWSFSPTWPGYFVLALVAILAVRGLYIAITSGVGPVECFIPVYLCIILPYFAPGFIPYLVPLFPFLIAYALMGLHDFAARSRQYIPVAVASITAVAVLFGASYARSDWGPIREGIGDSEFIAVCNFINRQTKRTDVIVFRKPRLMALLTEHPSTVYPMHLDRDPTPAEIWAYLEKIQAAYVIATNLSDPQFATDVVLDRALREHASQVASVYRNGHFTIYRLTWSQAPSSAI